MVEGATTQSYKIGCLSCGKEIRAKLFFCPFCGAKNEAPAKHFEAGYPVTTPVSTIKHAAPVKAVLEQLGSRDLNGRLDDAPIESDPVQGGKLLIDGDAVATVKLAYASGHGGNSQGQSVDKAPEKFSSRRIGNKGKLVALFAAIIVVAIAAMFVSSPGSRLDKVTPQEKPIAPTAKSSRDIAKIENQLTTVSLSGEWRKFDIAADPDRPVIALSAKRPFRIRVNGELYLVAASSSPEINFGNASFMELRAVDGNTDVKITRSARLGMNDG